jgi:small subunit ribosomal protein S13
LFCPEGKSGEGVGLSTGEKIPEFPRFRRFIRKSQKPAKISIYGLPAPGRLLNHPPRGVVGGILTPSRSREITHIMARILGIEIPNEKRIEASLPYMFGIGRPTAAKILEHAGIDPNIRTGQLSEDQLVRIAQVIQAENIMVEGDLRRERQSQLKRLTSINCYRGIRHKRGLPVRGQRTRTNARTRKGKKKTVGVKK